MPAVTSPLLRNLHTRLQLFPALGGPLGRVVLYRIVSCFPPTRTLSRKPISTRRGQPTRNIRYALILLSRLVVNFYFFLGLLAASFLFVSYSIDVFPVPIYIHNAEEWEKEEYEEEEEEEEKMKELTALSPRSRVIIPQSYVDRDGMFYLIYRADYFCKKVEKGAKSRGGLRIFFFC